MDRDKVKVILKEYINKAFDEEEELEYDRRKYIGDETISLMAEAALNVLLAVEDVQDFLKKEEIMK